MVFGNLWMLVVGGSFVAVPILLHLIMQQKPKPMLFPAVRFLRETFASNQRRLKLKQGKRPHWAGPKPRQAKR